VPPCTSSDSVQLENTSLFVGEEEISPGTFAGANADLMPGLLGAATPV
jgi:hypothetical protein